MAVFSRKPKLHSCFFCSASVPEGAAVAEHYRTHLIAVTDNNGHAAYTFKCPRCGLMDQAWGGGKRDPASNGVSAVFAHLLQRHNIDLIS